MRLVTIAGATLVFLASTLAAASETLFITCDNGLRCVRAPCPSRDTVLLPSGKRLAKVAPRLGNLTIEDQRRLQENDGLYHGNIVLGGEFENGEIVAKRIVRDAKSEEINLCRAPG